MSVELFKVAHAASARPARFAARLSPFMIIISIIIIMIIIVIVITIMIMGPSTSGTSGSANSFTACCLCRLACLQHCGGQTSTCMCYAYLYCFMYRKESLIVTGTVMTIIFRFHNSQLACYLSSCVLLPLARPLACLLVEASALCCRRRFWCAFHRES